jgi:hypothetical protein
MTKTSIPLIALLTVLTISGHTQTAGVELNAGYGYYQMSNLKTLMENYIHESGVDYEVTENFPRELNYGGTFVVGVGKFETGVDYRYYTSDGKLVNEDNAVESGLKIGLAAHSIGLFGKYPVIHTKLFQFKAGLLVSVYGSKASYTEYYSSASVYNEQTLQFRSKSIALTPFAEPVIYFTGGVYAGVRIAYAYDTKGALHEKKNNDSQLVTSSGEVIKTDWSGLRGDVFLGLRLNP